MEKILAHKDAKESSDNVRRYLVKWKNFSSKHNSWVPEDDLFCPDLLKEYEKRRKKEAKERQRESTQMALKAPAPSKTKNGLPKRAHQSSPSPDDPSPFAAAACSSSSSASIVVKRPSNKFQQGRSSREPSPSLKPSTVASTSEEFIRGPKVKLAVSSASSESESGQIPAHKLLSLPPSPKPPRESDERRKEEEGAGPSGLAPPQLHNRPDSPGFEPSAPNFGEVKEILGVTEEFGPPHAIVSFASGSFKAFAVPEAIDLFPKAMAEFLYSRSNLCPH